MQLTQVEYVEHPESSSPWTIQVSFNEFTVVVGKNATGKTRLLSILASTASEFIGLKALSHGYKTLTFKRDDGRPLVYKCNTDNMSVVSEEIISDGKQVLKRLGDSGTILDEISGQMSEYSPPIDKLTAHVRRDKRQYPYLEEIFEWCENYHTIRFAAAAVHTLPGAPIQGPIRNLAHTAQLLEDEVYGEQIQESVKEDMSRLKYEIEKIDVGMQSAAVPFSPVKMFSIQEKGFSDPFKEIELSSGMYSTFCTLTILNYLIARQRQAVLAIDDIGEGLDFERSKLLIDLILEKVSGTGIQMITTSNNSHLLNGVDVRHWKILDREIGTVTCHDYSSNQLEFDEFMMTGLNNFDMFSGSMYRNGD